LPEYDGLSVRLNKELLTLEQIDEQAQKLDMNRSKFVILALQMLVNFDVDFWKKIESYSKGLNIPEWAVIQNMITDRFAKEEAQRTVFGKSNSKLDDFMFFNTPNGPVLLTGSEFARIKYDNYVKEFEAKLFQRASVKQKAGKQLTDREQKIVEKFESIVGFEDEYDPDENVTQEELEEWQKED